MNFELIKRIFDFHLKCQQGMLFSEYIPISDGAAVFSDLIEDNNWNFAVIYSVQSQDDFTQSWAGIRKMFADRGRIPSLYTLEGTDFYNKAHNIMPKTFKQSYADAWMIFKDFEKLKGCENINDIEIRKISEERERDVFVETFNKAFSGDIEGDPYANLPNSYINALHRSFEFYNKVNPSFEVQHYIAWDGNLPVGTGSYILQGDTAELCSLGVIPKYRQQGVGKAIAARRIVDLTELGVRTIFLVTESGSKVEAFDKRLGYETIAIGKCFGESIEYFIL